MLTITEIGKPILCRHTARWSAVFNVYRIEPHYLISSIESAPVFATADEALAGADRALDVLAATDKFPNMCEAF
jgi:pantothenate kinase type III